MKILMLNYEFPPLGGGASPSSYEYARELVSLGHEVDVVTMRHVGLPKFEVVDGISLYRVPCLRGRKDSCRTYEMASYIVGALPLVLRLTRARKYDLNHTHFVIPTGILSVLLKRLTNLPYVITAHGSDVPGYNPDRFKGEHKLIRPIWKWVINGASLVVSPTEYLKQLILQHHPQANIRVISHGFDHERFRTDQEKDRKVLVVTRMLKRKGVQYFLEALRGVDLDGYQVDIVGDGPYLPELMNMAREYRLKVHFWGWLDNDSAQLKELYERSSVFVFTSEAENFPIVLLEAMSAGHAIITVDGTGCPEVVGNDALLVPQRSPEAIREALLKLTGDPKLRKRLGARARTRVESNFAWSKIVQEYLAVYRGMGAGTQSSVMLDES